MTRAVLLDLGNVVVGLDFERGYAAAAARWGLSVEAVRERIRSARLAECYESGGMSNEEFHRGFCRALGANHVPYAEFCELWGDMFQPRPLLSEDLLAGLAARYPLVLLSNTNDLHFRWIRKRYTVLRHFSDFVLSYQVGAMKPAEAMYQMAVERAGCPAEKCFFTDDLESNVEAARRHGIDAALFRGEADLVENLRLRGFAWD